MRKYFLTTERLGFSVWHEDDLQYAAELWGDPEVTRFIVCGGKMGPDQVTERLEREIEGFRVRGVQYWPIFLRENDRFVGCCGLRPLEGDPHRLEMGVHLVRAHWGERLATEACTAVIGYGFDGLNAESIFAGHHPQNRVSAKLLACLGFRFVGERYYPPTGLMHPSYCLMRSGR